MSDDNILMGGWRDHGDDPQSPEDAEKAKLLGMEGSIYLPPFDDAREMQADSGSDVAMRYARTDLEKALKAGNQFAIDHWTLVIKHLDEMERD